MQEGPPRCSSGWDFAFKCRGAGLTPSGGDRIPNKTENRSNTVTNSIKTTVLAYSLQGKL